MRKTTVSHVISFFLTMLLVLSTNMALADEAWLIGKWKLFYDPDGSKTDYIDFKADGDAISSGPEGEYGGFYVLSPNSVKAVFTYKGKDFIMTFHYNEQRDELRIVTSHTGRESIYRKIPQ